MRGLPGGGAGYSPAGRYRCESPAANHPRAAAADGRAALHRRGRRTAALEEIAPSERVPILRRYLDIAPGARPHFPIDRRATPAEFAAVADRYPVFRIHTL